MSREQGVGPVQLAQKTHEGGRDMSLQRQVPARLAAS